MQQPKLIPMRQNGLASKHNLPLQPTTLIGREEEVQAASALLRRPEVRLLTLTGTPGIGKTRLALQVATELTGDVADGVHFVPLAPVRDSALVITTITHSLGLRDLGNQPAIELLTTYLRDRHLLLVIDNFEQVIAAAPFLAELLEVCPELKLLVTSREVLHLRAEHQFPVPPLALPDLKRLPDSKSLSQYAAVNLFLQRARAVKPDFQLTSENTACIAEICARLDGLPLAIELAAARIKLLSPQALLARLDRRLQLLTGGAHDLPERQRTLRNTIEWSYELLHVEEQRLFRRLAVFVGGCQLSAAEALCRALGEEAPTVFEGITSLIDKSLLQQVEQEEDEPRLLMLETIREYALERLAASGEAESMRRQHATFFLALAEKAFPKMFGAEQSTWYNQLEADHDNLRAALGFTLESQEAEMGLRLVSMLYRFWRLRNHVHEGRSWYAQVLAHPGTQAHTAVRTRALRGAGFLAFSQGDFPEAQRLLEESVSVGREVGAAGKRELASALATLAHVSLLQGNLVDARELAGESLQLFQEIGEAWGTALALHHLGKATIELGDPAAASPLLEESAVVFRMIGDRQLLAQSLNALGMAALRQSDYTGARAQFEEALAVAQETDAEQYIADALAHLGTVALRMGDYPQAAALYGQSLAINGVLDNRDGIAECLAGVAAVASLLGQPERAAWLCGAVEALHEASNIRLSPLRRAAYDRIVEGIRANLDQATFVEAWGQGRAMPLEQAIDFAVETQDELLVATVQQASEEEAASDLPSNVLSSPPSPPLSPRRAMKQHYGGLTTREREVARLVARGKSNRAIADELVVGISTVEAHITHIFTKLGFSSRARLAAWAVDKGLAQVPQDMEDMRQKH